MLSYHGDPQIKARYIARFEAHRKADEVIQGTGYDNGRGCFVGCTLNNYDHSQFPLELGWPEFLAHLADTIFEGLPPEEAPQFGTDLLAAVPVGVDLMPVRAAYLIMQNERLLARLEDDAAPYAPQCRDAIHDVISALRSSGSAWSAAESAVGSAAESALAAAESAESAAARSAGWSARSAAESAESAARSAARSARSAGWSAELAARSAGWSARSAALAAPPSALAAESAARSAALAAARKEYCNQRDDLLGILRGLATDSVQA